MQNNEWHIGKVGSICVACQKAFEVGEALHSTVSENPETFDLIRKDYCLKCWPQFQEKEGKTSWKTIKAAEHAKKMIIVDNDVLLNLFERLKDSESERNRSYAYLLALILMRKRVLVFDDVRMINGEEHMIMSFRIKKEGENNEVSVVDPQLNPEQIASLNNDLNKLIQVGEIAPEAIAE